LGRRMDGPPLPISSRSAPIQSDRHKTAT
jgi:hypothetical protein